MTTAKLMPFRAADLKLFWYWISEREKIRQARVAGYTWPWTRDPILQEYKFTNVFRRQDRTTIALVERMVCFAKNPVQLYNHINTFRLFNRPDTYDEIYPLISAGEWRDIESILRKRKNEGLTLFTGAYIIHASTKLKYDKLHDYILTAKHMWQEAEVMVAKLKNANALEYAVENLQRYNHVGPFIAYELACDYAYFPALLGKCTDRYTWANTGPGAARGVHRLLYGTHEKRVSGLPYNAYMKQLLIASDGKGNLERHVPKLEMRDIEHSLCEYDKYCRVKHGEGKTPKQKYRRVE